MYQNS